MPNRYIEKINSWLIFMGEKTIKVTQKSDEQLLVKRSLEDGKSYNLYVMAGVNDLLTFQSLAFKTFSGDSEQMSRFYQYMLMYNSFNNMINFGITNMAKKDEWGIVLTHNSSSFDINPEKTYQIIKAFDNAYTVFIPHLKKAIIDAQLGFTGTIAGDIKPLLDE